MNAFFNGIGCLLELISFLDKLYFSMVVGSFTTHLVLVLLL
jgi:hypothetical protein